jgi:uncharacterized protein YbaA (DUF1428 family)
VSIIDFHCISATGLQAMYIDGFVIPLPRDQREAYREMARKGWEFFKEFGATRQVECWGDRMKQ